MAFAIIFPYVVVLVLALVFGPLIVMEVEFDEEYTIPEYVAFVILWPITLIVLVILGIKTFFRRTGDGSEKMSRKQRREIEFLKQKAAIAQSTLDAQIEFERLIIKE